MKGVCEVLLNPNTESAVTGRLILINGHVRLVLQRALYIPNVLVMTAMSTEYFVFDPL
jgi:hypothetical protein